MIHIEISAAGPKTTAVIISAMQHVLHNDDWIIVLKKFIDVVLHRKESDLFFDIQLLVEFCKTRFP